MEFEKAKFEILNYLDIYKTVTDLDSLQNSVTLQDSDELESCLEELKDEGYVEDSWEITSKGERYIESYRQEVLEATGEKEEVLELCENFEEINVRFKQFITEEQEKQAQTLPGEESEPISINGLENIHSETVKILKKISDYIPTYGKYIDRFELALEKIKEGKKEYLVKNENSYHQIWFEVHENLLNLAGREREE